MWNSKPDANSYGYTYSHRDIDAYGNCNSYADSYADEYADPASAYAKAAAHAVSSADAVRVVKNN